MQTTIPAALKLSENITYKIALIVNILNRFDFKLSNLIAIEYGNIFIVNISN